MSREGYYYIRRFYTLRFGQSVCRKTWERPEGKLAGLSPGGKMHTEEMGNTISMITVAIKPLRQALLLWAIAGQLISCMDYGPMEEEDFGMPGTGVFITHEGNFMYGNASLSYYLPSEKLIENEVFIRSNGMNLGDVAQSMSIYKGLGYVVVNNSGIIFVIDIDTFKVLGTIGPMTSPRYIHFLSDSKAYVTQLWDNRIVIVNPTTFEITGYIETEMEPGMESTEQMVQYGQYVFTNCWSYNDRILVIDTETDRVVDQIRVGIQPTSLAIDKFDKIWTVTDGGYVGSPYGYTTPALYRIDARTREVEMEFTLKPGDSPSGICMNGTRDTLYFINEDIWRMEVTEERVPLRPFIENKGTIYYGLAVDPNTSEIYVADAIDYVQPGIVYRYSSDGELLDSFYTGITPGSFCFK